LPAPDVYSSKVLLACVPSESTKSKPAPRRLSFTKCVKIAPLATVISKLSPAPSRARSVRKRLCGRSPFAPRPGPLSPIMTGGDVAATATAATSTATHDYPVDPPPPYQMRAATHHGRGDFGGGGGGGGAAAPVSPSRFTTITSIEAVRAPDSPVPVFPSPKLSTESVFGSTQSLASLSGTLSDPRCPPRNPMAGFPGLKRKRTMRSGQRNAMTCTRTRSVIRST